MAYAILLLCCYLLGSISSAFLIAKLHGADLRTQGSGNLGASNATVLLGWKAGVAVAAFDVAKGVVSVLAARWLFPDAGVLPVAAGLSAVMGHIFPVYLHFKGGKGFATYMGMTLALNWKLAAAVFLLAVLITVVTEYIALATIFTTLAVPAVLLYQNPDIRLGLMLGAAAGVIVYKHRSNLRRIAQGTEIKLGSTIRGENKIKK